MNVKEPKYPALLLFGGQGGEYVVIATEGPINDHAVPGFDCVEAVEIDDVGLMPIDEPLWRR